MTRADLVRRLVLLAGAGPAPAYAVARCRAAVDLARALDPLPPSFDVADLLLSLHPMAQLQNDDDANAPILSVDATSRHATGPPSPGGAPPGQRHRKTFAVPAGGARSGLSPGHEAAEPYLRANPGRFGSSSGPGRLAGWRT